MTEAVNDNLVLICGKGTVGKSTSLMNLENVLYLNCENGKKLPFKPNKFLQQTILDPYQVYEWFQWAEAQPEIKIIVVDGLNFLMDLYESMHVLTSSNTQKAWGGYSQYFKNLMHQYVAKSTKDIIFIGHAVDVYNEKSLSVETQVPVKGALKGTIESYFSCIVSAKQMKLKDIEAYNSTLLNISDKDRRLGFKRVFQTDLTVDTVHEKIRSPLGLFAEQETFIDNDSSQVLKRLHEYYAN